MLKSEPILMFTGGPMRMKVCAPEPVSHGVVQTVSVSNVRIVWPRVKTAERTHWSASRSPPWPGAGWELRRVCVAE